MTSHKTLSSERNTSVQLSRRMSFSLLEANRSMERLQKSSPVKEKRHTSLLSRRSLKAIRELRLISAEGEKGKGGDSVKRRVRSSIGGKSSVRKVFPVKEETIREALQVMKGRKRAVRNLNVFRRITLAIGIFNLAKLNRRRAKELCAAEVKRGLRKYRAKAENYVIPVVKSPHSSKAIDGQCPVDTSAFYNDYTRFSPAMAHRRLYANWQKNRDTTLRPDLEHFQTILFFADISGFTRLSERLSAEKLEMHTNNYFTLLIDVVVQYGGDIIKFCGDAVMIIWPCDLNAPNPIQTANAVQAAKCALVMLQDCGKYNDGRGNRSVSLRLHCGIGAGPMYGYTVGYEDRWEYLVAGDPLRQVGEAEPEAAQGQVVVSPEMWSLISSSFVATKTPKGNYLLRGLSSSKPGDGLSGTFYNTVSRMPSLANTWGSVIIPKGSMAGPGSPKSQDRGLSSPKSVPNSPVSGNVSPKQSSSFFGSEAKRLSSPTNRLRRLNTGPSEFTTSNNFASDSSKVVAGGSTASPIHQQKHKKRNDNELCAQVHDIGLHDKVASALLRPSGISSPNGGRSSCASLQCVGRETFGINDSGCSSPTDDVTYCSLNEQQSSGPPSPTINRIGSNVMGQNAEYSKERFGATGVMADVLEVEEEGSTTDEEEPERIENQYIENNSGERMQMETDQDPVWLQASKYLGIWLDAQYRGRTTNKLLAPLSGALRGFCQESARYAIESNTVGYLAELRKVITIFINILGLDQALLQGELVSVQQVMELGVRCMGCFGGVVRQFVVDDKGCVMIAAFGLPQYSFEDNEVRAISAAHDMLSALRGIDLKGSIGITAGTVYCGYVGAERRREYAMMGTSVNLSARLMSAALPDTICVDGEVFTRAQEYFHFEHLQHIKAKGYSSTVPVFRPMPLIAESSGTEDDSSDLGPTERLNMGNNDFSYTVGQQVEVSMLSAVAKRLISGGGKVVLLNGQAGSGKTHLLHSTRITALGSSLGFETVTSFCSGVYTTTPYFAWRAILSSIFSLPTAKLSLFPDSPTTENDYGGGDGASSNATLHFNEIILKERSEIPSSGNSSMEADAFVRLSISSGGMSLDASIGEGDEGSSARESVMLWKVKQWVKKYIHSMTSLTPLLDLVLGCGDVGIQNSGESTLDMHALDPEVMYRKLDELIIGILRVFIKEAGGQPLMLVCENAQWLDGQSMKLLHKVACVSLPILIVLSSRPLEEYYEPVPQELIALHEMGVTIEIQPLCAKDCLELSRWIVGPLATKENPTLLPEEGGAILLKKSGGNPLFIRNIANTLKDEWERLGTIIKLEDLPESFFHDLIVSRFDSLEHAYQAALKAASVIGPIFTMSLLLHMIPGKPRDKYENLHIALLHLIEANFISRTVVGKFEHFRFVHGGVHETIYKMMLTVQRQRLNEVCASWYEKHYTHSMTYSSLITHHWLRSDNTMKKIECLVSAAASAKKACLNDEVIKYYSALLSLAFGTEAPTSTICSLSCYWKYKKGEKEQVVVPLREMKRYLKILSTKIRLPWKWLRDNTSAKKTTSSEVERKDMINKSRNYEVTDDLTKGEKSMLIAKENDWLSAGDFILCPDLVTASSEPNAIFSLNTVCYWIGEMGLAYYKLGHLIPAYNNMQEALLYLNFQPLPRNASLLWPKKLLSNLNRYIGGSGRFRGQCTKEGDVFMAARLYAEITDICLKAGQAHRIDSICLLSNSCSRRCSNYKTSVESGRLLALFSVGHISLGRPKVALEELAKAKKIAEDNKDYALKGDVCFASGIYHSALGLWDDSEADFCSAFEHFAELGDSSRCCVVMIESAYVKICQGGIVEADTMFQEVKDMAHREDNQYLMLTSLYGKSLTETMMGLKNKAMNTATQCEGILKGKQSIHLEGIKIYLAVAEGCFEDAIVKAEILIHKLRKTKQMWFSLGFYLHLVSDAISTALEYNLLKGVSQQHPALRVWKAIMRSMATMSRSFDMMTPFYHLAHSRWYMLHGKERLAEAAINLGLRSEEVTHMPYAIGLLLLHSSRLCCLGDKDRRARAKKGRSILQEMKVSLLSPTKNFSNERLKHLIGGDKG